MTKHNPIFEAFHQDERKYQRVYRFQNGYGASVVQGPDTFGGPKGLWELAVVRFEGDEFYEYVVDKTTSISNEVIGDLPEHEIEPLLIAIASLRAGRLPSA